VPKLVTVALAVIAFGHCMVPSGILAQTRRVATYTVSVGPSFYRLPELGHGTAFAASGSFHWRRKGPVQLQVGITGWGKVVTSQAAGFTGSEIKQALLPEVGVRLAGAGANVRPYISAGAGLLLSLGGLRSGAVLYTAAGMDWHLRGQWSLHTGARLRSIRPFAGRTLDVSLGLGHRW
jgi:hypothetical protein